MLVFSGFSLFSPEKTRIFIIFSRRSFYQGQAHPEFTRWSFTKGKLILRSQLELLPKRVSPRNLKVNFYQGKAHPEISRWTFTREKVTLKFRGDLLSAGNLKVQLLPGESSPWNHKVNFYQGKAYPEISRRTFIKKKLTLKSQGELLPGKSSPCNLKANFY